MLHHRRLSGSAVHAAAASPPTFTFLQSATASGSTTITATGINFGTASANRRLYVFLLSGFVSANVVPASSFIGGTTNPDFYGQALIDGSGGSMWWATAVQPSGTSGDITIVLDSNPFGSNVMGIYSVDTSTLLSKTPVMATNTVGSGTTLNKTVTTLANGSLISALWNYAGTSNQNISASTETLTLDANNVFGSGGFAHANNVAANASSSVTWSWTGSSGAGLTNFAFR